MSKHYHEGRKNTETKRKERWRSAAEHCIAASRTTQRGYRGENTLRKTPEPKNTRKKQHLDIAQETWLARRGGSGGTLSPAATSRSRVSISFARSGKSQGAGARPKEANELFI